MPVDREVVARRRLNTGATRRLVLAFAVERHRRGRPSFGYRDVYAMFGLVKGLSSKPTLNAHVNTFEEEGLVRREGSRDARFEVTDLGMRVYRDWGGGGRITIGRARRRADESLLEESQSLARQAAALLDDLMRSLQQLARAPLE